MNCDQAGNLFDAYLDGELSQALAAELDTHRLHCAVCRHEMALLEVAGHVIASSADGSQLGDNFTDRLLACVATEEPKRSGRVWLFRVGVPLVAAAGLIFALSIWNSPERRVLGDREEAKPGQQLVSPSSADTPTPASTGLDVDEAAAAFQQTVSGALQRTRQTSQSLVRFGHMTLLQVIDALQLEQLRNGGTEGSADPAFDDETTPDDADDIEDM